MAHYQQVLGDSGLTNLKVAVNPLPQKQRTGGYAGSEIRTDTYVYIETLIYDLRQNKLVWAGQTKTMNPSDVEGFVTELAAAISKELRESGMVAKK
jgi:hypothetical protein